MKYGFTLILLGLMIAGYGIYRGGYWWMMLWPAANFLAVGGCYFTRTPGIFGKRKDGTLPVSTKIWLFPLQTLQKVACHAANLISKENAFDHLDDRTIIGRRLSAKELPAEVDNVIDLTCEFEEPGGVRSERNYLNFPILDASIPEREKLADWVKEVHGLDGVSYIHCAYGHGRTGLFTAALLMHRDNKLTVVSAIEKLKAVRPQLECNAEQMKLLEEIHSAGTST